MFFDKQNTSIGIINGIQIDDPMILIPWDIGESDFTRMLTNQYISQIVDKNYLIKNVTIFRERNCDIGVTFEKTIRKVSISRGDHGVYNVSNIESVEELKNILIDSYKHFQITLLKEFGKPNKQTRVLGDFESCEWEIGTKIKIYHYIMDRFGLAEFLIIEHT